MQTVGIWLWCRVVFRALHVIPLVVCACLVVVLLAACGGGSRGPSGETVAQVGSYAITKPVLNQWMTEKANEDFYEVSTHLAPPRLVSEPADYPACVASLKAITPSPGEKQPHPTDAQLMSLCRELHQSIKLQALKYLVSSYWSINFDAAHGISVSDEEVQRQFAQTKARRSSTESRLAGRSHTPSQELFMAKLNLLGDKVNEKLNDGGAQLTATLMSEAKRVIATANCRPGYVVEYCKGYREGATPKTRPPVIPLEEIARWRPETSHGYTGVPVT
jgi:hypothetical protein